jgi:carbon-monoxide dehydrogenase large subunit
VTRARLIGSAVKRVEDPRLFTGAGTYIGDLMPAGVLHAQFVRSPYANARITNVDTTAALSMPGVAAVFTAPDVNDRIGPLPGASSVEGARNPKRTLLADGVVRFVGEAVAVVVAETSAIARDAADAVVVDYDPLPAVVDLDQAAGDAAPLVHDSLGTNICFHQVVTGSLGDYAAVRAGGLPMMENHRTVTVSPSNPLGVKGIGEAGTIGSVPTVANAVADALSQIGIRHVDIPATPERIWRLIQSAPRG